ncbi:MAG: xylose isomerase, partial [Alphaproteobacteria bacterium]|nr:xylose isomerase [Alphaproteobacteria bacterium]
MSRYFDHIEKIKFEGVDTENPLAFRYYDKDRVIMGKTMEEHLRFAVCYWHNFCWMGTDPFGAKTMQRPWDADVAGRDPMEMAHLKLDTAFDFFTKIGTPYFCFHDRDVAPEGISLAESNQNLLTIVDAMERKISETGVKLLWGTANLFSHPRYMAGAATNPDPEIV